MTRGCTTGIGVTQSPFQKIKIKESDIQNKMFNISDIKYFQKGEM